MTDFDSSYLKQLPVFREIPLEHLSWLLSVSEIVELQPGGVLFDVGQTADHLCLLLDAQLELSVEQSGRRGSHGD